jgi:hypothetical protein
MVYEQVPLGADSVEDQILNKFYANCRTKMQPNKIPINTVMLQNHQHILDIIADWPLCSILRQSVS